MSTVMHKPEVEPVQPNEKCDANCIAWAVVAMLYPKKDGTYGRLTWCGHHFADLHESVVAKAIAVHDGRI